MLTSEQELRAKIAVYAGLLTRELTETEPAAVAAALRLILIGVLDPRLDPQHRRDTGSTP